MLLADACQAALARCRLVVDSIDKYFPDQFILEPDIWQNKYEIYTETHFVLAQILLVVMGAPLENRFDDADRRLRRWKALDNGPSFELNASPFNNFANCLSLLMLRRSGISHAAIEATLDRLCAAQRLDFHEVADRRSGNNMYIMAILTQLILRPIAMGSKPTEVDVCEALAQIDQYHSADGFYFDAPRRDGPAQFPLTYCVKFLFLIGIVAILLGDERFTDRFRQGVDALLPYSTRQGNLCYLGRSDYTSFANGLTVFCLLLAASLNPHRSKHYLQLATRQLAAFNHLPRSPQGWLKINRFGASNALAECRWAADGYNFSTEYSCASVCYVLLAFALSYPDSQVIDLALPVRSVWSADLGIAALRRGDGELIYRFGSNPEVADRRYWGPTILHFAVGEKVLVGTVPHTSAAEFPVRYNGMRGLRRNVARFWHYLTIGPGEYDAVCTGFLPVLWLGSDMYLPGAPLMADIDDDSASSSHVMLRSKRRGIAIALGEFVDLTSRTLLNRKWPRQHRAPTTSSCHFRRTCRLFQGGVLLEDTIEGAPVSSRLFFGVRGFSNARWDVEGLEFQSRVLVWGSDGLCTVAIYTMVSQGGSIAYSARLVDLDG